MATGKKFYWFKLKDTFLTSDAVDMLMEQPNGASYVILYQILCIKTINTGGRLERVVGEMRIKYDAEKIARDSKWFSVQTVKNALKFYKALGLLKEDKDGVLYLVDYENLVGCETDYAEKKSRQRQRQFAEDCEDNYGDNTGDNVPTNVPTNVPKNVPTDIRYKRLDIRDKSLDIRDGSTTTTTDISLERVRTHAREETEPPTLGEVVSYFREEQWLDEPGKEAEKFVAYNDYHGWTCLPDWKKAANLWAARSGDRL